MPGPVVPFAAAAARLLQRYGPRGLERMRRLYKNPFDLIAEARDKEVHGEPGPDNPARVLPKPFKQQPGQEPWTAEQTFRARRAAEDLGGVTRDKRRGREGKEPEVDKLRRMNRERQAQGLEPLDPNKRNLGRGGPNDQELYRTALEKQKTGQEHPFGKYTKPLQDLPEDDKMRVQIARELIEMKLQGVPDKEVLKHALENDVIYNLNLADDPEFVSAIRDPEGFQEAYQKEVEASRDRFVQQEMARGPDPADVLANRQAAAQDYVQSLMKPRGPEEAQAEMMARRTGAQLTRPAIEGGTQIVTQDLSLPLHSPNGKEAVQHKVGGLEIDPSNGNTVLTLVGRQSGRSDVTPISIPFEDRDAALQFVELFQRDESGLPTVDELLEQQNRQLLRLGINSTAEWIE